MSQIKALIDDLVRQARSDGVQRFVVGAVIELNGRILLLKRRADDFLPGIYELPSGEVGLGEELDVALAREVEEETGLRICDILGYVDRFDYLSRSGKLTRQFNFAVTVSSGGIRLSEHEEYLWAAQNEPCFANVTGSTQSTIACFWQSRRK